MFVGKVTVIGDEVVSSLDQLGHGAASYIAQMPVPVPISRTFCKVVNVPVSFISRRGSLHVELLLIQFCKLQLSVHDQAESMMAEQL